MDKQIIDILIQIRTKHGEEIFNNRSRLNALLADYTDGKYKGECNLINVGRWKMDNGGRNAHRGFT
jgi:hypothetical protein